MRRYLAPLVALGLCCGGSALCRASDPERMHLPGPFGRFWGIGYSAGYHAHQPSRPERGHRLHARIAPEFGARFVDGPPVYIEDSSSLPSSLQPGGPAPQQAIAPSVAPSEPQPAPVRRSSKELIQQPPRDAASPSDRSTFIKRLPNARLRDAADVSDLPPPPSPPKKASVARSSILEHDAR